MLGLHDSYLEKDLEEAILKDLQAFLMEVGHRFTFVANQTRVPVGSKECAGTSDRKPLLWVKSRDTLTRNSSFCMVAVAWSAHVVVFGRGFESRRIHRYHRLHTIAPSVYAAGAMWFAGHGGCSSCTR